MPDPVPTPAPVPAPAPAPSPAPAPAPGGSWVGAIPEGPARDIVVSKGYAEPKDLAHAYYNLTRIHTGSGDVIERPRADATPEQLGDWYRNVNGVTAETKYDLKFADGLQVDQPFMETAKGWFKDAGLRPEQAQALADKYNAYGLDAASKASDAAKAKAETDVAQLRTKYDAQGKGAFDMLIANGTKAAKSLGLSAEFLDRLDAANGVAANMEMLAILGERMGQEAGFHDGAPGNLQFANPESARVELAKLSGDKTFVDSLLDPKNPMHAVNMRKHADLQKVAYGKK